MKAMVCARYAPGAAAYLIEQELPDPVFKAHDLLVRPIATASSPGDYKVKNATESGLGPRVLGWGAEAFKRDGSNAEARILDTGFLDPTVVPDLRAKPKQ
jgi:hypothetical protein